MPRILTVLFACILSAHVAPSDAQSLFDQAVVFGGTPETVSLDFNLATETGVDIAIFDPGSLGPSPELDALFVSLIRGSEMVYSASQAGTATSVMLTPGEYELRLVGVPSAAGRVGSLSVTVSESVGGSILADTVTAFELPAPTQTSPAAFEHSVTITEAGDYELALSDMELPTALSVLSATLVPSGGAPIGTLAEAGTLSFSASPGEYSVFVYAELADSQDKALLGVSIRRTAGEFIYSAIDEIGDWFYRFPFDLGSGADIDVSVTDLAFPQALLQLQTVLIGNGERLSFLSGTESGSVSAESGEHWVYVLAEQAFMSAGSFGLQVTDSTNAGIVELVQDVVTDSGAILDVDSIDATIEIDQAGDYTLSLVDFGQTGFFDALESVSLALTDNVTVIGSLSAPGAFDFSASPGSYSLALVADPSGVQGSGLIAVSVSGGPSDELVYEQTAAVGVGFYSVPVSVSAAASIDVEIEDFAFPGPFDDLRAAITVGSERVGEIVSGGSLRLDATAGTYVVNLLAEPDSLTGYSTLGLSVSVTPDAPFVVLSSSAVSAQAGGLIVLSWTATAATSCTASGAWSGEKGVSGSESVGPLHNASNFVLSCTGPGGSHEASVTVDITPEQRSGGGSLSPALVTFLLLYGLYLRRLSWIRCTRG